ncbi:hypothetical protein KQI65_06890 [bacterium]|nr:hypothetical protein [bacterium]
MRSIQHIIIVSLLLTLSASAQQYANGGMFSTASIAGVLTTGLPFHRSSHTGDDADKARFSNTATRSHAAASTLTTNATIAFTPVAQPLLEAASETQEAEQPAPADLHMFAGARIGEVIQLRWESVSDRGTKAFAIERRSQIDRHWKSVGYMRSAQTADRTYTFLDNIRDDGVAYYRLRQLREDGSAIVSPVISVTPDAVPQSFSLWTESSAPFQTYGTVSFGLNQPSEVKVTLHDRYGTLLATLLDYQVMNAGHHVLPIATSRLEPGLYFLQLHSASGSRELILLHS